MYLHRKKVFETARLIQLVFVGITWCHVSFAKSMCTSTLGTGPGIKPLPKFTGSSYTAYMEYWDTATQTFNFRQEFVDQASNTAAIRIYGLYDPGDVHVFISDYNSKQLFTVSQTNKGKFCTATALEAYETDSFPFVLISNRTREHIASTHTLLHFGVEFHEVYKGTSHVRGKMADKWTSCIYSNDTDTTVITDYYFSAPGWFPDSSNKVVPLRSVLTSDLPLPQTSKDLRQTTQIDYVYFSREITDRTVLETASGMYCEGRKAMESKPVPEIPDTFQFRSQLILPKRKEMNIYNIMYDFPAKLVLVETTSPSIGPRLGVVGEPSRRLSVSDFSAGITYLLPESSVCEVTPISPDDFITRYEDPDHIRISTVKEFTRFATGNFVYSGQVKVHDVNCDTWTGETTNFPEGLNSTSYWTWHFNSVNWTSSSSTKKQVPVYLDIKIPQKGLEFQMYIYDFQSESPDWADVDVSQCFLSADNKMKLQFTLIGNLRVVQNYQKLFRRQMVQRISEVMKVSLLRISGFQNNLAWTPPTLSFNVLGLTGVKGDTASSQAHPVETSSDQAVQKLNDTVNSGLVFLRFFTRNPQNVEEVVPIFAAPSSLQQTIEYSNGTKVKLPLDATPNMPACSTTMPPASSLSSSPATLPPSLTSSASKSGLNTEVPRVSFLGGVTRMQESTTQSDQESDKLCSHDHTDSSWSTKNVAGLCAGVAVLGLLVGVIGTGVVQGWARPCLKFKSRQEEGGNLNSYSLM